MSPVSFFFISVSISAISRPLKHANICFGKCGHFGDTWGARDFLKILGISRAIYHRLRRPHSEPWSRRRIPHFSIISAPPPEDINMKHIDCGVIWTYRKYIYCYLSGNTRGYGCIARMDYGMYIGFRYIPNGGPPEIHEDHDLAAINPRLWSRMRASQIGGTSVAISQDLPETMGKSLGINASWFPVPNRGSGRF